MNILQVHNKYCFRGGEDAVVDNERRLLQVHGDKVWQYVKDNSEIENYNAIGKIKLIFKTLYSKSSKRELEEFMVGKSIDIIHVHNTFPLISPSIFSTANKKKIPIVMTVHNFRVICPNALLWRDGSPCEKCINGNLWNAVRYRCYRNSFTQSFLTVIYLYLHRILKSYEKLDKIIVLSEFDRKLLSTQLPKDKLIVKPNFCDNQGILSKEKSKIKKNDAYYLYVGRLSKEKGPQLLIQAFKELPNYKLIIVGQGPDEAKLVEDIDKLHLGNIILVGQKNKEEILKHLENAEALLVPSQCYETFGLTVIESYSVGTPVLGSNIGNIAALIENGVTGYTFQYNSVNSIISCINYYESRREERTTMSKEIRKRYEEYYSEEKNYILLKEIYNKVIKDNNRKESLRVGNVWNIWGSRKENR